MKDVYILFTFITSVSFAQLTPQPELQRYYSDVDFSLSGIRLYTDLDTETIAAHSPFLTYSQRHD